MHKSFCLSKARTVDDRGECGKEDDLLQRAVGKGTQSELHHFHILARNYLTYFNTIAAPEWFEDVARLRRQWLIESSFVLLFYNHNN